MAQSSGKWQVVAKMHTNSQGIFVFAVGKLNEILQGGKLYENLI